MYKKVKNLSSLIIFFIFVFLITKFYFSEENIIFTNKSRSSYYLVSKDEKNNLPILKNDTNDVIFYINSLEDFKNKRKKRAWENLISNSNE